MSGSYQQDATSQSQFISIWSDLLGPAGLGVSEIKPDSEGWYNYIYSIPPDRILLQFSDASGYNLNPVWLGYAEDLDPLFNIAYLYWRYTGIGRHQMEPKEDPAARIGRHILFYQLGDKLPISPASVGTSAALPNTTAVYTGKKKPKAKKKAKK